MNRKFRALAALVSAGLAAIPVQAKGPVTLEPISDWEMGDASPDGCIVVRFFGDDKAVHVLRLEQNWPGDGMELWAAGQSYQFFSTAEQVKLQLREAGKKTTLRPVTGMLPAFGKAVIATLSQDLIDGAPLGEGNDPATGMAQLDPEKGAQVSFVSLQRGSDPAVRLMTGGLEVPFAMLNQCALKLLAQWGLDPATHRTASRLPRWRNEAAIKRKVLGSYRAAGLATGERGKIKVRLTVDATGKVQDCDIIKSAATEGLNSPVCAIMAEAEFDPALDANGAPFASFFATSVIYVI